MLVTVSCKVKLTQERVSVKIIMLPDKSIVFSAIEIKENACNDLTWFNYKRKKNIKSCNLV